MCLPSHVTFLGSLILVLGLAVIVWGTAYKTSLYHSPEPGRAPAKLCTRASDASKAKVEQAVGGPLLLPLLLGDWTTQSFGQHQDGIYAVAVTWLQAVPAEAGLFQGPTLKRRPPPHYPFILL